MLDSLKEIILDFQEAELATGVPRRLRVTAVPGKATVCIGPRRSGKSTFMFQLVRKLLASGVSRENILYLNFFDDRLRQLQRDGLVVVLEAYFSLYPEKKNAQKVYCFFDEIQTVPGWEAFVDRVMRTEVCEVYITGSSARMLSREIATQMRGRALSWELFRSRSGSSSTSRGLTATASCPPADACLSGTRSTSTRRSAASPRSPDSTARYESRPTRSTGVRCCSAISSSAMTSPILVRPRTWPTGWLTTLRLCIPSTGSRAT